MSKLRLFKYFCLFVVVTAIFGSINLAVQQNYRMSANDPQIQIAEDLAASLNYGKTPQWNPIDNIDASKSLATFVNIYDASGTPILSTGPILIGPNGKYAVPPAGVFDFVNKNGEDRITWQPKEGLRYAAVIVPYNKGYVLAARSLREVEVREAKLNSEVGIPYIISIILMTVYCVWKWREVKKMQQKTPEYSL
jgi:hypothetical protein